MPDTMAQNLRDAVADAEARPLPSLTQREARLHRVPGKIDVAIGMRRVGKSRLLLQTMHELMAAGVARRAILHLDFEDERLSGMQTEHLRLIDDTYHALHPELVDQPRWFFFDEIHNVPQWDKYVRRLLNDPKIHLALTGSSAKLLSTEIATSLRGRALSTEVLPFSFREVLRHRQREDLADAVPGTKARAALRHEFTLFQQVGGFPEAWSVEERSRSQLLQGYLDVVLLRDVMERHRFGNAPLLRDLVRRLLRSMSNRITTRGLSNDLQSMGHAFDKNAIYALLGHLADAFLCFLLPLHTDSEKRRQVNPKKLYAIDHGLVRACVPSRSADEGHVLENIVYLHLRTRGRVLGYHLTASGREVDFVCETPDGLSLVQAAATIAAAATREREVAALTEAMAELRVRSGVIITLDDEATIRTAQGTIQVVPAWRELLRRTATA
jgi:uncharacterized protein